MPLWKRKLFRFTLLLSALFALGFWAFKKAPFWAADYVNEKYPFVEIRGEDIELGYPKVLVRNVHVKKSWIDGTITKIVVDVDKNVWIKGGNMTVSLDLKPKSTEDKASNSVKIKEVFFDTVTVLYKEQFRADTKGFRLKPESYCVQSGKATFKDDRIPKRLFAGVPTIDFKEACVKKDRTTASIRQINSSIKMPSTMPKLGGIRLVELQGVEVFLVERFVKAERLRLGDKTYVKGEYITVAKRDDSLYFDAKALSTNHSWLSPNVSEFKDVSLDIPKTSDLGKVSFNGATLRYSLEDHLIEGDQLCSEWVAALPSPTSVFNGMASNFKGNMAFEVQAKPVPHVSLKKDCKYTCTESPIKELRGKFTYEAYKKDGTTLFTRETGPGTKDWVDLRALPINVASAFIRMEDPSFLSHRGILTASLKVALEQNLEKGYFFRGGSTITQQLAKNLWLKRHKTVGRKVEEAFLTMALESCLSKDEILELYLNVVELGPDVYGIGPALQYYFDKGPGEMNLDEAYYLAGLLPSPLRAKPPLAGGLEQAKQLMTKLAANGFIDEDLIPIDGVTFDTSDWKTD